DRGERPPELEEREAAQLLVEPRSQLGWASVAVGDLPSVREVSRPRRDRPVGAAAHVEPPEELGAREGRVARPPRLPHVLARYKAVRLLPEQDLGEVAVEPAVGDDPVAARREAGHVS